MISAIQNMFWNFHASIIRTETFKNAITVELSNQKFIWPIELFLIAATVYMPHIFIYEHKTKKRASSSLLFSVHWSLIILFHVFNKVVVFHFSNSWSISYILQLTRP